MRLLNSATPLVLFTVGLAAVGCGSSGPVRNAVSGTVTYKSQPIKSGTISFRSDDDQHVGTGTITDGKYAIPWVSGLPAGKYIVAVSYPDPRIPAPREDEPPGESVTERELLPARYNENTELKAEIKNGTNDVSYDLK